MTTTVIDLRSSHRLEADGSYTIIVEIGGMPSIAAANKIGEWLHDAVRANAHKIGRLDPNQPKVQ